MSIVRALASSVCAICFSWLPLIGCHSPYEPDCLGEGCAARTVQSLIPSGLQVYSEARKDFVLDGQRISLSVVRYGELRNCDAGCSSSVLCGLEDDAGTQIYYAAWYAVGERSPAIALDCPSLVSSTKDNGETWPTCSPPGLRHPVTNTSEFQALKQDNCGKGFFRSCFNRCCRPVPGVSGGC